MELLPPTLDITFKMLMTPHEALLRNMIEAVLGCSAPLRGLTVLNPEPQKVDLTQKEIVLDIRVRLDSGSEVDLEMQTTAPEGTRERFLYYWARTYAESLPVGGNYRSLRPAVSVLWFAVPLLKSPRFHSTFQLMERCHGDVFTEHLVLHVLELPKLDLAAREVDARLLRWARFLRVQTREELAALAAEDPIMNEAAIALEELSADPEARRIARERREAIGIHNHLMAASEAKGKAEGIRDDIRELCDAFGITVEESRLEALDVEQLRQVFGSLLHERKWPEGL
jgi:predicted transposase/invertase (TIGR01784 family)